MNETRITTEKELRELAMSGMTYASIAKTLGRSKHDVYATCRVLGIKSAAGQVIREDGDRYRSSLVDRMANGELLSTIAKAEGKNYITLYQMLRRYGLPTNRYAALNANRQKG